MTTKEVATEYRMGQWAQIMQERVLSGESISKFCENRGIRRNRYFYWQSKLRESACTELIPVAKSVNAGGVRNGVIPKGWAMCKPEEAERETSDVIIEVGKFRINVGANASPEHIENVCRGLMPLC